VIARRDLLGGALGAGVGALAAVAQAGPSAPARIVDAHVHVWTRDPKFPWAKEATNPPTQDATPEMLLALMKDNGVARTVIVQVSHYRWDHRYLIHTLRAYPQSFVGVARVNPEDPAAPDELARLVHEHKLRGLRLNAPADAAGDFLRGPLMLPLWERCRDLGIVMAPQTKGPRLPDFVPLIEKFPDLTVVVDHFADIPVGEPQALDALLALARYPKVFVKVTHPWWISKAAYPYADALTQVKRVYDRFGPRRMMWGSDWPGVEQKCGYGKALALARDEMKFLGDEDRRWLLGKTAESVWRFTP
jgi:L-fuconolactonase